ncbi:universal stress protein [Mycobacterium sp. Y57]|uniref:universal stress protein n=1 Tax=Mycolicibacterium xanthum TaxID=2796469 RepID=UPI001C85A2E1|nr:universal stress protein [Mycolicibacterium xanthum]MBX7432155.1 universal stress protein [Mycolicibacterium xanthum]
MTSDITGEPPTGAIIVGVDASASSRAAVAWAARDAELRGLPLRLVHVQPPLVMSSYPVPDFPAGYARAEDERAKQAIEQAYKLAVGASSPDRASQISTEVHAGPIAPMLVDMSKSATMVVVGCLGESAVTRAVLGSVSSGLVHHAHCPVAVIHGEVEPSPQAPVLVGVDGSPASERATAIAFDEASRRGVDLVALHAWTDMGKLEFPKINWAPIEWRNIKVEEEEVLAERLSGWQTRYPDVTVHRVVVADRPAPRMLEHADSAQLVVVGSHGRGASRMLLGSVGSAIVNSAQIPVIVARRS